MVEWLWPSGRIGEVNEVEAALGIGIEASGMDDGSFHVIWEET